MTNRAHSPYAEANELVKELAAGSVSAVELTEEAIARVERYDDEINALVVRDFDRARDEARRADRARAQGRKGALLGAPVTVKESFNVAGLPTTWGLLPFRDFIAASDALAVQRLRSAGAIILGKTNVPVALGDLQTYNPIYGTTNNPWNLDRTPGGSSGGSAAALAAGFGTLSIGSDIAGSLRLPAHFTGVFAHKPTFGLLPTRGHTPPPQAPLDYARDLAVIGPIARSATDLMLMLDVLAGLDETGSGIAHGLELRPPRHDRLADYRVLVLDTHPLIPTSTTVRQAVERLAAQLDSAGAKVERDSTVLPDLVEDARIYMRLLLASTAASYPAELYEQMRAKAATVATADTSLAAERTRGSVLSYRDWIATDALRARKRTEWGRLFQKFDVVVCPVSPTPAFAHDHTPDQWSRSIAIDGVDHDYADQLVWAGIASASGLPATVAPIGRSDDGLPIGVQIIGPLFEDRTPIRFAELIEEHVSAFSPPPLA